MGIVISVKALWTQSQGHEAHEYSFEQTRLVIGRARGSDVQLPHPAISATHASIHFQPNGYVIIDEGSTNGTRVNDDRLVPGRPKPLRTGDRIDLGGFELIVDVGMPVAQNTSTEITSALAKRMVRELLEDANDSPLSQPTLTIINGPDGGKVFEIPVGPSLVLIGRAQDCDLTLNDADASRHHAEVQRDLENTRIRDLESKNGVLINERMLEEKRLSDRDQIRIGTTELVFEDAAAVALSQIEAQPDERISLLPISDLHSESESDPAPNGKTNDSEGPCSPSTPPARASLAPGPSVEFLIYGLAGLVLLACIAAFYWLLRGQ